MARTLVGKWAYLGVLPKFGPLKKRLMTTSLDFRGGALDYFSHTSGRRPVAIFWGKMTFPIHRARLFNRFVGQVARGRP